MVCVVPTYRPEADVQVLIEDLATVTDVLVTDDGHRVLGRPIPKTAAEVEEEMGGTG